MIKKINQKGFVIAIVLVVILIIGIIVFSMNQLMVRKTKFSSVYEKHLKLKYASIAGIEHAFHVLKAKDFAHRFYFGKTEGVVDDKVDGIQYKVVCKDGSFSNTISIVSTALIGKDKYITRAEAKYKYREELLAKTSLFTKYGEYRDWYINYK